MREAKKGDRTVGLADVSNLKVGYSGLANLSEYRAGEALITGIEGNAVTLSKPLPKDLGKAGTKVAVTTFWYRPFSAPGDEDYRNTIDGWKRYVGTVADFVAETLGSRPNAERGFDLEIWNELSFGSSFLSINNYYDPKLVEYKEEGIWEGLVRETAALADRQPDRFRGVTLVDGFRNTIPWPSSSREPARVGALSAHPYPVRKVYPRTSQPGRRSTPSAPRSPCRHSRRRTRRSSRSITPPRSRLKLSCGTWPRSQRRSTTSPTVAMPG